MVRLRSPERSLGRQTDRRRRRRISTFLRSRQTKATPRASRKRPAGSALSLRLRRQQSRRAGLNAAMDPQENHPPVDWPVAILAGGLATRLRPITEKIPKLLVEVAGEPFFSHQIRLLKASGLSHFVLCVGHLGEMIVDRYGDGSRW